MRYSQLKYKDKIYTNYKDINDILLKEKMYWLIDSEIEDAQLEIKNNTIIWHNGNFYSGNWYYGIFKSGKFYGVWENGDFAGKWISGINLM